jgi:hypothetical protein
MPPFGFGFSLPNIRKVGAAATPPVTTGILLENGVDFLLLENGDFLLQG